MKMMKPRLLLIALLFVFCASQAGARAPRVEKTPAQKLIERLTKLQKRGIMYGHQDDPFYGITWEWEQGRSDTYDLVGDYPGVMGFDLGGIEMGDDKNLDSVPFNWIREEIIKHYERGGIVTLSWHPRNPMLGTTAWIESDIQSFEAAKPYLEKTGQLGLVLDPRSTVREILPGGKGHDKFMTWLKRVEDFILSLTDKDGKPVPVIFRPWHEYNGGWFWWGKGNCTDEDFLRLWNLTQDYLNKSLSKSIVWSCSPNLGVNPQEFYNRWPGDDRVDLLGLDAYQWGTEEDFVKQCNADMDFLDTYAQEHGLLLAITECGYKNSPDATWWSRVLLPIMEKHHPCYFLPYFKQMAKKKQILFVKDIKKVK